MSAATHRLRRAEAVELVGLLELVGDLCICAYSTISVELAWRAETFDAGDLRACALRLAERVAATNGLTRTSRPTP